MSIAFLHSLHDTAWEKAMNLSPFSPKMSLIQFFRKNSKCPRGVYTSWPRKSGETPTESTSCGNDGKDEKGMRRSGGSFQQIQVVPRGHTFQVVLPSQLRRMLIKGDATQ